MTNSQLNVEKFAAQLEMLEEQVQALEASETAQPVTQVLLRALAELNVTVEELRVAEEELRVQADELATANELNEAQRRRYQDLFDAAPEGYLVTDALGVVMSANRAAGELLNRPPDRLQGKPVALYVHADASHVFRQQMARAAKADEPLAWDTVLKGAGAARPRHVACRVAPIRDAITGELLELRWFLHDITDRKRAEDEVQAARQRLAEVSTRMEAVREAERRRIAQAVHDEIGAALTAIKIDVTQVRQGLEKLGSGREGGATLLQHADAAVKLIDETMQTVRRIAMEMRPAILDDFGLVAALDWQLNEFQKRTQLKCQFNVRPGNSRMDPAVATAVFRVFQELLTNVARHAGATEVLVGLSAEDECLVLRVQDNGRGIRPEEAQASTSLGLLGIRERVRPYDGTVEFMGRPGQGTLVRVKIPLGGEGPDGSRPGG